MSKERQINVRIPLDVARVLVLGREGNTRTAVQAWIESQAWEILRKAVKKAEDREKRLETQHES